MTTLDSNELTTSLVTVIVPVYNVEPYLRKCVQSVLDQTYPHIQVLLVNDGSTDGGGEICDAFAAADPRVSVISQPNSGLGSARNAGISRAAGAYLLFLDGDDFLQPNTIRHCIQEAEKSGAEVVIFGFTHIGARGKVRSQSVPRKPVTRCHASRRTEEALLASTSALAKLFSTDLVNRTNVQFPPRAWYEDLRTIPKYLANARFITYLSEPDYCYLERPSSIMRNATAPMGRRREIIDAIEDLREYFADDIHIHDTVRQALEFLAVKHVILFSTLSLVQIPGRQGMADEFTNYVRVHFPGFQRNVLIRTLPMYLRILLWLALGRHYFVLRLAMQIRSSTVFRGRNRI